ncbi:MAG: hypothetical protein ACRD5L_04005, partial [Bryobacteraceae bacterium]
RIQMDSTDLATGEVTKREILVDADRLRMNETGESAHTSVLFLTDGGQNRMLVLDTAKNEYREIDQQMIDQMSALGGQAAAAAAQMQTQMQAQMKNMTPEQRAVMEQMMKGRGIPGMPAATAAPVRTVYTAKGSGSANGFACTKYEGDRGAEKVSEVCAADPGDLKFAASDFQVLQKMKEFTAGLQTMANSMIDTSSVASLAENGFSGFPVQQTSFKNGQASSRTDTKVIESAALSNADFSLGNSTKVELMGPAKGRGKR